MFSVAVGRFVSFLDYKCEKYNKTLVKIDERYTTQTCCNCNNRKKMTLGNRIYKCEKCGLVIDRDLNSSINILYCYAKAMFGNEHKFRINIMEVLRDLKLDTFVYI